MIDGVCRIDERVLEVERLVRELHMEVSWYALGLHICTASRARITRSENVLPVLCVLGKANTVRIASELDA